MELPVFGKFMNTQLLNVQHHTEIIVLINFVLMFHLTVSNVSHIEMLK